MNEDGAAALRREGDRAAAARVGGAWPRGGVTQRLSTAGSGTWSEGDEMRGIILAAGKGSRLNGTIGDKPKCLLRVGGKTLVERQIEALQAVGIDGHRGGRRMPGGQRAADLWATDHLRRELALRPDQQLVFAVAGTTSAV